MNLKSIISMAKQAARMYAWRANLAGDKQAEFFATMLQQNVSIFEQWQYAGALLSSDNEKTYLNYGIFASIGGCTNKCVTGYL